MANEKNLIPINKRAKNEQREIQSKGGKARAKKMEEKKTIQKLLTEILDSKANTIPQVSEIAAELGVKDTKDIKSVYTIVAVLNTLKTANLSTLEALSKLIGEETQYDDNNKEIEETLAVIKECAYADRDKS